MNFNEGRNSNSNIYFLRISRIPKATAENTRIVIKGDIVENIERDSVNVSKLSKSASFDRSRSEQKHMAPGMQRNRN